MHWSECAMNEDIKRPIHGDGGDDDTTRQRRRSIVLTATFCGIFNFALLSVNLRSR